MWWALLSAICLPYALCLPELSGSLSSGSGSNEMSPSLSEASPDQGLFNVAVACQEFRAENAIGSGWSPADCEHVWTSWAGSLEKRIADRKDGRQFFLSVSRTLRRQNTPCYLDSEDSRDGAGSMSLRQIAALVLAEEMGCDCLLPQTHRNGFNTDGRLYCHQSKFIEKNEYRCAQVDWVEYFTLADHMVPPPNDVGTTKTINVQPLAKLQNRTKSFLAAGGFEDPPWVHWILHAGMKEGSKYFTMPHTWNAEKLQRVRELLAQLRTGFRRRHRRPSSAGGDECGFGGSSRTDIAIHLRLGDRDGHQAQTDPAPNMTSLHDDYYDKLEDFMDRVAAATVRQGEAPPVFHIFSETAKPCPSTGTATFDEFLRWPVETNQIKPCTTSPTPDQCWEKEHGAPSCPPDRSGVFLVQGRPLYLHVGLDVENAMSCMIEADALLMGCSTFGQVAGLFSEGIKFFSINCRGWMTGLHYKMMPPMAVAEQGKMWVPITGSWRDPAIYSEKILEVALSRLFDKMNQ